MISDETFYGLVALAVFVSVLFISLYAAYRSPAYGYQPKVGQNRRRMQSQVPRPPSTGTAVRQPNSGGSTMRKPDPLVAEWYADDGSGLCSPPSNYRARDPYFHGTVDYAAAAEQIRHGALAIESAHREHNSRHYEDTPPCRSNDSDGSGYSDSHSHSSSCHDSSSYDSGSSTSYDSGSSTSYDSGSSTSYDSGSSTSYDSGSCDSSSSDWAMARCENPGRPSRCEQDLPTHALCVRPIRIYRNPILCSSIESLTFNDACDSQPIPEEVKQPIRLVGLRELTLDQLHEIADRIAKNQIAIYKAATKGRYGVRDS